MTTPAPVRVWTLDLAALHAPLENVEDRLGLLAPTEREWGSSGRPDVARLRRTARLALRIVLLSLGWSGARGIELQLDGTGKPHLAVGEPPFSVSHSSGQALIAIGGRGPLGVDLETERNPQLGPERRALLIAGGFGLRSPSGDPGPALAMSGSVVSGNAALLTAWTRLEAIAKARGTGIGALLSDLGITARGARERSPPDIAAEAARLSLEAGLAVLSLELAVDCYGALAAPVADLETAPLIAALKPGDVTMMLTGLG